MATNKERLEANNAKIEGIIKALENKIIGDSNTSTYIKLPEEFSTATLAKTFVINNTHVLISANETSGLWLYNIAENNFTKIYEDGRFSSFQQIDDNNVLLAGSLQGLWRFNLEDKSIVRVETNIQYNDYHYSLFQKAGDVWLIISGSLYTSLLVYDPTTNSILEKHYAGGGWSNLFQVTKTKWLASTNTALNGVGALLVYDSETRSGRKIYEIGSKYKTAHVVSDDRWLIFSENAETSVLSYNPKTDEISVIYTVKGGYNICQQIGTKTVIGSNATGTGVLIYDYVADTIELKYTSGSKWEEMSIFKDRVLISSTSTSGSSSYGILVYDSVSNEIKRVYTSSYKFAYRIPIQDKCILSQNTSESTSIFIYDYESNTVKTNTNYGGQYDIATYDENGCYLKSSGNYNPREIYYNYANNSIKLISIRVEV